MAAIYTPGRCAPAPPVAVPPLPTDPALLALHGDVMLADAAMTEAWAAYNRGDLPYPAWAERRAAHRTALDNLLTLCLRGAK